MKEEKEKGKWSTFRQLKAFQVYFRAGAETMEGKHAHVYLI